MKTKPTIYALGSLLTCLCFAALSCTDGQFAGASGSPSSRSKQAKATGGDIGDRANGSSSDDAIEFDDTSPDPSSLSVQVGGKKDATMLEIGQIVNCVSQDTSIATVDAKTCVLTGIAVGETTLSATLDDGTVQSVAVHVTPVGVGTTSDGTGNIADSSSNSVNVPINTVVDAGQNSVNAPPVPVDNGANGANRPPVTPPPIDDGSITSIRGKVCLGGPLCNVTYLTRTEADAQACRQAANTKACVNDSRCGAQYKLQVCNCECDSAAPLPFDDPTSCRRHNPEKSGGRQLVPVCHKI